MNKQDIRKFLHFGYLPLHTDRYPFEIDNISLMDLPAVREELKKQAHYYLKQAVAKNLSSKKVVVPLSGGVDSRIILAELFHQTNTKQLQTVTFGVPGNLDAEIPARLTRAFGIKHQFVNLLEFDVSEEKLIRFASEERAPANLLEAYYSRTVLQHFDSNKICFSGFIGDRITGSVPPHFLTIDSFEEAKIEFLKNSRVDQTGFLPALSFSDLEIEDDFHTFLSPYEKLDYKIRQVNMTIPIVLGSGFDVHTPLIDPEFVSFFYSIDPKFRKNQSLFFEMAAEYYPEFFRYGVKNFFGATIQSSSFRKNIARKYYYSRRILNRRFPSLQIQDPIQNYTDPYWFYVKNKKTRDLTTRTISDLSKRSVLKDIDPMLALEKVQKGDLKFKNALEVLFNLEIYLKTGAFE